MRMLTLLAVLLCVALTPVRAGRNDAEDVGDVDEPWTPLERISLGRMPMEVEDLEDYKIPKDIPSAAREILVYAYVRTGVSEDDGDLEFRIFTREGKREYSFYMFSHVFPQQAFSYNSQTFWLPMTSERRIYVETEGDAEGGKRVGVLYILGYR